MSGVIYTPPPGGGGGSGSGGSYTATTSAETRLVVTNTTGAIASGKAAWRIANTGTAEALVGGVALQPGETVGGQAYTDPANSLFVRCPQIGYDATGTQLSIYYKD